MGENEIFKSVYYDGTKESIELIKRFVAPLEVIYDTDENEPILDIDHLIVYKDDYIIRYGDGSLTTTTRAIPQTNGENDEKIEVTDHASEVQQGSCLVAMCFDNSSPEGIEKIREFIKPDNLVPISDRRYGTYLQIGKMKVYQGEYVICSKQGVVATAPSDDSVDAEIPEDLKEDEIMDINEAFDEIASSESDNSEQNDMTTPEEVAYKTETAGYCQASITLPPDLVNTNHPMITNVSEICTTTPCPLTLKDTVDGMQSNDYDERFIAEYTQVAIRYKKLKTMCEDWDNGELILKPACSKEVYERQRSAMYAYVEALKERATLENIILPII